MLRHLDSMSLAITALVVSTGLLIAAVSATRVETAPEPVPFALDFDCPRAKLVLFAGPVQ